MRTGTGGPLPLIFRVGMAVGMPCLEGKRKGQRCRVLVHGKLNARLIEFEDGFKAVVNGNALRKAK